MKGGLEQHLAIEEDTPLRTRVRVPRHPAWGLDAAEVPADSASRLAVDSGIGLQCSSSKLHCSLAE